MEVVQYFSQASSVSTPNKISIKLSSLRPNIIQIPVVAFFVDLVAISINFKTIETG